MIAVLTVAIIAAWSLAAGAVWSRTGREGGRLSLELDILPAANDQDSHRKA